MFEGVESPLIPEEEDPPQALIKMREIIIKTFSSICPIMLFDLK